MISSLIPVRKVPYSFFYLKLHIVHPVLQMWMHSNFDEQYGNFYGGQNQGNAMECLTMPIELINGGLVPYCGSNDNNWTGVSLSEILFSFMLEKYFSAMHVDWDPLIWV